MSRGARQNAEQAKNGRSATATALYLPSPVKLIQNDTPLVLSTIARVNSPSLRKLHLTSYGHKWVTFAFSRKSKCDSWGPLVVFLDSYLSSVSGICFFRKKQMPLTDDWYESRNTKRGPQESHLLFPEKANATHTWQIRVKKHKHRPCGVTFAFSGKSKCHSQMTYMTQETRGEAPRSHICFFRKKQMPLTHDRSESRNTSRGPLGVTFAFSRKSKCHSHMTDPSQETQA